MEAHGNIKCCMDLGKTSTETDLGKTPTETYKMLQMAKGEHKVSRVFVFKWNKQFSEGQLGLEDESHTLGHLT